MCHVSCVMCSQSWCRQSSNNIKSHWVLKNNCYVVSYQPIDQQSYKVWDRLEANSWRAGDLLEEALRPWSWSSTAAGQRFVHEYMWAMHVCICMYIDIYNLWKLDEWLREIVNCCMGYFDVLDKMFWLCCSGRSWAPLDCDAGWSPRASPFESSGCFRLSKLIKLFWTIECVACLNAWRSDVSMSYNRMCVCVSRMLESLTN